MTKFYYSEKNKAYFAFEPKSTVVSMVRGKPEQVKHKGLAWVEKKQEVEIGNKLKEYLKSKGLQDIRKVNLVSYEQQSIDEVVTIETIEKVEEVIENNLDAHQISLYGSIDPALKELTEAEYKKEIARLEKQKNRI